MVLGLTGSENVQAVQKYITGLDARRLSKFPENRYLYYHICILINDHFSTEI
jgi:hypothetical protein